MWLQGYAGVHNDNVIVALQVETASCIENIDEIAALPGLCVASPAPIIISHPATTIRRDQRDQKRSAASYLPD